MTTENEHMNSFLVSVSVVHLIWKRGVVGGYIWIWKLHLKIWTHFWFWSQLFTLSEKGGGDIWIWKLYVNIGTHFWFWSQLFTSSEKGVYLNLNTYILICHMWCSSIQGIYAWLTAGSICHRYICALFCHEMCQVWCSSIQGIYAQVTGGVKSTMGIYALFSIYRSSKFGVVVFKASMLTWWGTICYGYMCIVLYIYRSAKFSVVVFKVSMLKWPGESIYLGYICIVLYI